MVMVLLRRPAQSMHVKQGVYLQDLSSAYAASACAWPPKLGPSRRLLCRACMMLWRQPEGGRMLLVWDRRHATAAGLKLRGDVTLASGTQQAEGRISVVTKRASRLRLVDRDALNLPSTSSTLCAPRAQRLKGSNPWPACSKRAAFRTPFFCRKCQQSGLQAGIMH
jgi:hypothetical protein